MKRILSVLLIFGALSAAAEDSYLYWMLDYTDPQVSGAGYDTVRVKAFNSADEVSYLGLYGPSGDSLGSSTISASTVGMLNDNGVGLYAQLMSGTTYKSFVIELLNDSSLVAQSSVMPYSEALASYYIETANSIHLSTAWVATSFAIPEPNSAMLLLLGCAALGLRRRRRLEA